MVEKKLNFNQPILSVRRYSQKVDEVKLENAVPVITRLPPYRSEPKSGPVRNPGAVPFRWEQIPGRPKEQIKPHTQNCDRPPIAAMLPSERYPKANQHGSHQFAPSTRDNRIQPVFQTRPSLDENIKNFERSKETTGESRSSSDSGDICDEAFVDGVDSLSRTESFLLNCSMSGLIGTDDLDANTSRRFLTDARTREFMRDRFLPASKAMALEKPQYAPKKQSAVREQPQQPKKTVVNQDKPALRCGPSFAKIYSHYHNKEEKEVSDDDDDSDQHENLLTVCCLLPRSCLKSSVCILNPVPAMSMRTQVIMTPANRIQSGSSSAGSLTDTENEYTVKPVDKIQTDELKENKTSLKNEIGELESHNDLTCRDGPLSIIEDREVRGVPEDTKHAWVEGFGSRRKSFKTLQELLADQDSRQELDSRSRVQKTVYVDTLDKMDNMGACSPNTKASRVPGKREDNNEITTKRTDQIHTTDSSLEDFKKLNTAELEAKLLPNAYNSGDFNIVSSIDKSDRKWGTTMPKAFEGNEDSNLDFSTIEVAEKKAAKNEEKQLPRATTLKNSHEKYSEFPVPPTLPKSPSDSWLYRALPSMSARKSSLHSYLGAATNPQKHCSNVRGTYR